VFSKYPIESHYDIKDEDRLIKNEYSILIDDVYYNAINAKIVQKNNGVFVSLALHKHLRQNSLSIKSSRIEEFIIFNLFGEVNNTQFIDKKINDSIIAKSRNFEKLQLVIGQCCCSERFVDSFNNETLEIQEAIINHFIAAKDRNGNTPFYADSRLIKDVTPEKETKVNIFELRIFEPVAYRVYFHETTATVYLGFLEKKPNKKTQSNQIKVAINCIKSLIFIP
jgi:hypothetical protein